MAARTDHVARGLGLAMLLATGVACKPAFDPGAGMDAGETGGGSPDGLFDEGEWERLQTHALPDDPPDDPTNDHDLKPKAIELGQKLFFDTGYSGSRWDGVGEEPRKSCADATCHDPDLWFQAVTTEAQSKYPFRNSPTLVDVAFYEWYAWEGARDSLWSQNLFPPEAPMKTDRATVVRRMLEAYRDEYVEVFGDPLLEANNDALAEPATPIPLLDANGVEKDPDAANDRWWDDLDADRRQKINRMYANFGKAIAAYERQLVSQASDFDRFLDGDEDALNVDAKRGLRLFEFELPCAECHAGPTFSDDDFHNIGIGSPGENADGRHHGIDTWIEDEFNEESEYGDDERPGFQAPMQTEADRGKFRTKHLRQVAGTGRFMHDGSLATLEDVIRYYDDLHPGIHGLDEKLHVMDDVELTNSDVDDIVAFLESLTGDEIPAELRVDTSATAP